VLCGNYLPVLTNLKILLNDNMTYCKMNKGIKKLNSVFNQLNFVPKLVTMTQNAIDINH